MIDCSRLTHVLNTFDTIKCNHLEEDNCNYKVTSSHPSQDVSSFITVALTNSPLLQRKIITVQMFGSTSHLEAQNTCVHATVGCSAASKSSQRCDIRCDTLTVMLLPVG